MTGSTFKSLIVKYLSSFTTSSIDSKNRQKCTFNDVIFTEELKVVERFSSFQSPFFVEISESWLEFKSVEDDLVDFEH